MSVSLTTQIICSSVLFMPRLQTIKMRLAPVAWLLAGLVALAPLGPHASKLVLCFGMDGHIAAETSHAEDCVDVPIPTGNDAKCSSFKAESGPATVAVVVTTGFLPLPVRAHAPARTALPAAYGQTDLHRSVVLLI